MYTLSKYKVTERKPDLMQRLLKNMQVEYDTKLMQQVQFERMQDAYVYLGNELWKFGVACGYLDEERDELNMFTMNRFEVAPNVFQMKVPQRDFYVVFKLEGFGE